MYKQFKGEKGATPYEKSLVVHSSSSVLVLTALRAPTQNSRPPTHMDLVFHMDLAEVLHIWMRLWFPMWCCPMRRCGPDREFFLDKMLRLILFLYIILFFATTPQKMISETVKYRFRKISFNYL